MKKRSSSSDPLLSSDRAVHPEGASDRKALLYLASRFADLARGVEEPDPGPDAEHDPETCDVCAKIADELTTLITNELRFASDRAVKEPDMKTHVNDIGDMVCEHGTAVDVHCCGCHSGFLFDSSTCTCLNAQLPDGPVGDLLAFGQEEATSALTRKDRDDYQFWQGWNAALERVKPAAEALFSSPASQKPDYLIENLRGMCACRESEDDSRICRDQPSRTIRDYCSACLAAERLAEVSSPARPQLERLIAEWRERARLARPLESAKITAEKRARITEWMFYTNRANELEAALAEGAVSAAPPALEQRIKDWLARFPYDIDGAGTSVVDDVPEITRDQD